MMSAWLKGIEAKILTLKPHFDLLATAVRTQPMLQPLQSSHSHCRKQGRQMLREVALQDLDVPPVVHHVRPKSIFASKVLRQGQR
jgi:hypothetical protein